MKKSIQATLNELEKSKIGMHEMQCKIGGITNGDNLSLEEQAEHIAFHPTIQFQWVKNTHNCQILSQLDLLNLPGMIQYWDMRYKETNNLLMKLQYIKSIVNFSQILTRENSYYKDKKQYKEQYIDILLKAYETNLLQPHEVVPAIIAAYRVAANIKHRNNIKKIIAIAIFLEESIDDGRVKRWGFCFEQYQKNYFYSNVLVNEEELTTEQKKKLIHDLESRLIRLVQAENLHGVEKASRLLAQYYKDSKEKNDVQRVLKSFCETVVKVCKNNDIINLFQKHDWCEQVCQMYKKYTEPLSPELLKIMIEIGFELNKNMGKVLIRIPISKVELNEFRSQFIAGDLEFALTKIAKIFIPNNELVTDLNRRFTVFNMISSTIFSYDGLSSKSKTTNSYLHLNHYGLLSAIFYSTFCYIREYYSISSDDLLEYLYKSPLFADNKKEIFREGLRAYFKGEYICAICTLLPQIEACLRKFVELNNENVFVSKGKTVQYESIDNIYNILNKIDALPNACYKDLFLYCKNVLIEQSGLNLRHSLCHGIIPDNYLNENTASIILHILLCISTVCISVRSLEC